MANAYHGKIIIGELSDAQTLPNATSEDSDAMVGLGATKSSTGGTLWIDVYANTAISIASGQLFYIELQSFTADTAASADSPFSSTNSGGVPGATGTAELEGHYYILHKTSADGACAWDAGDLITQCAVPEDLLRLRSQDFIQLRYETDADESSEKVDAFVYVKPS